jgi:fucose permease
MRVHDRGRWAASLPLILAYVSFIGLGLVNSRLNVVWPSLRASFGMPIDALGVLLLGNTVGYTIASAGSGWLSARLNFGMLLALSGLALAAALLGSAVAPLWALLIALSVLTGLGTGVIDAGVNAYAGAHFSPRTTNWLHASFGIGATLGPALMTIAIASSFGWRAGFALLGLIQLLLAAVYALTRAAWRDGAAVGAMPAREPGVPFATTLRLPMTWLGMLLFFASTGLQVSAGQWVFSLLTEGRGVAAALAGTWVSLYWASATLGRIVFGVVVQGVGPIRLLRYSMLGSIGSTLLLWLDLAPWLNFASIALLGLALAPHFPLLVSMTPHYLGPQHAANGTGLQVAASAVGAVLTAGLIGILARTFGLESIGVTLFAAAVLMSLLFELLARAIAARGRASAA